MERECSCGLMSPNTQETSLTTTLREKEFMNGVMDECTKENGKITKCMVKESLLGKMEGDMRVNM